MCATIPEVFTLMQAQNEFRNHVELQSNGVEKSHLGDEMYLSGYGELWLDNRIACSGEAFSCLVSVPCS